MTGPLHRHSRSFTTNGALTPWWGPSTPVLPPGRGFGGGLRCSAGYYVLPLFFLSFFLSFFYERRPRTSPNGTQPIFVTCSNQLAGQAASSGNAALIATFSSLIYKRSDWSWQFLAYISELQIKRWWNIYDAKNRQPWPTLMNPGSVVEENELCTSAFRNKSQYYNIETSWCGCCCRCVGRISSRTLSDNAPSCHLLTV